MSTEQPAAPTEIQKHLNWVAKNWGRLRLGHEGFMLDKIMRQQRFVEQDARNAMTGDTNGDEYLPDPDGDDAMGVNIGDHIHYHTAPESKEAQPEQQQPRAAPATGKAKAALLAAGLATGLIGGSAIPWLAGAYDKTQPADTIINQSENLGVGIEVVPGGAMQ